MASYVVSKHARQKLRRLLDQTIADGMEDPIDIAIRKLVMSGEVTALCTMPFLTSVRSDCVINTTMIERGQDDASAMALYLIRAYFFIGKDEAFLNAISDSLATKLTYPDYFDSMLGALRFIFSEQYRPF